MHDPDCQLQYYELSKYKYQATLEVHARGGALFTRGDIGDNVQGDNIH